MRAVRLLLVTVCVAVVATGCAPRPVAQTRLVPRGYSGFGTQADYESTQVLQGGGVKETLIDRKWVFSMEVTRTATSAYRSITARLTLKNTSRHALTMSALRMGMVAASGKQATSVNLGWSLLEQLPPSTTLANGESTSTVLALEETTPGTYSVRGGFVTELSQAKPTLTYGVTVRVATRK